MALALLGPAIEGEDALADAVDLVRLQLRAAMFLTGSRSIGELKNKRVYITGTTRGMIGKRRERYNGY
jgi:isopentenyl-diphosphate delta-isomerase